MGSPEFSPLAMIEVLTALLCKDAAEVSVAFPVSQVTANFWQGNFNGVCGAMKLLFPAQHPLEEKVDVEWADQVLASASPQLIEVVKESV